MNEKNVRAVVSRSLRKRWKRFASLYSKTRKQLTEKNVHDLRVATRRLRVLLKVATELKAIPQDKQVRGQLKKVLKTLGPLRDLQVWNKTLSKVETRSDKACALLLKEFDRQARKTSRAVKKSLRKVKISKAGKRIREIRTQIQKSQIQIEPSSLIDFQMSNLIEQRSKALDEASAQVFHQMRIACKKHRYTLEVLAPLLETSAKDRLEQLRGLQNTLGRLHDLDVMLEQLPKQLAPIVDKHGLTDGCKDLLDSLRACREPLLKESTELCKSLS